MKKLFQQHGEWVRWIGTIVAIAATNYSIFWLKANFVERSEFERHCEGQAVIVSNVVSHMQMTPIYIHTLEDHEGRIRTLEVKVK